MERLIATPDALEQWKNAAAGVVVLQKYNQQGQLHEVRVAGGGTVHLTPHERRINQEMAADDSLDVFMNGMLAPVRLIDSESDTETLQANTNAMSESAMKALFRSQIKTFTAKVNEITNPITVSRLLEMAQEVDASVRQEAVIKDRLSKLSPNVTETGSDTSGARSFNERMAPVAPR